MYFSLCVCECGVGGGWVREGGGRKEVRVGRREEEKRQYEFKEIDR